LAGFSIVKIEHKFIDLKELKMLDTGNGSIEGYRSVFGEIDEGGDIVIKGAFADCMNEYLASGFSAHSHDWKFTEAVGYPVDAREDDYGWFVKSEFHSTQTAQDARTIASERKAAGKQVGFSFGYLPVEYEWIDAKDFKEKLPQYVKTERLETNLAKAQKFNRIRVLKKVEAPEDSLVLAGMNKLAAATAVKGRPKEELHVFVHSESGDRSKDSVIKTITEVATKQDLPVEGDKGMLADQLAQTTPSTWEIESAFRRVICKIAESAKNAPLIGESGFDWRAKVAEVISEYGPTMQPLILAQIEEFLNSTDEEFYLKGESVSGPFESFDTVVSAVEKHTANMQRNHAARTKEGRILSTSNRAKVVAARDALDELLTASEPQPKGVDMATLRTQSQRRHSAALAALAPQN
jgi:HK97 family phage prohead protease